MAEARSPEHTTVDTFADTVESLVDCTIAGNSADIVRVASGMQLPDTFAYIDYSTVDCTIAGILTDIGSAAA